MTDGAPAPLPALRFTRAPIFDRDLNTIAYRVLVPDSEESRDEVAITALIDGGLDAVVGSTAAWLPVTYRLLAANPELPLDPAAVVLDLPHLPRSASERSAIDAAVARGMRCAVTLDDGEFPQGPVGGLRWVCCSGATLQARADEFLHGEWAGRGALVATEVDSMEAYEQLRRSGASAFQGEFIRRPSLIVTQRLPGNRTALLQLLTELQDDRVSLKRLESLLAQEPGLAYRVLRCLNSPVYSLPAPVRSLEHGVVMLGLGKLRNLVALLLLSGLKDWPSELTHQALVRARTLELLAQKTQRCAPDQAFSVGVLSFLEPLLLIPMDVILAQLPIAETLRDALAQRLGPLGRLLQWVEDHENARWDAIVATGGNPVEVTTHWLEALKWARGILEVVGESRRPEPPPPTHSQRRGTPIGRVALGPRGGPTSR